MAMTPQQMLRAMVALERAPAKQPGATVEVIGYDDEAALNLMALRLADQVRLGYRPLESHGHQELYAFMHQDPKHPGPVLLVPVLAGAKVRRAEDKWLW
jgi:hypothetical protein